MNVQNKVIVITGGAGGIGSAQAKLLARNGAEVWILDLVQEKIDPVSYTHLTLPTIYSV